LKAFGSIPDAIIQQNPVENMKVTVNLEQHSGECLAICPELEISCYGATQSEAMRRIQNVLTFYISSARELGLDVDQFELVAADGSSPAKSDLLDYQKGFPDTVH